MRRKAISIVLTVWALLMVPMTVFAQSFDAGRTGTVSVTLAARSSTVPIRGAEFSLYWVATVVPDEKGELSYAYTDAFEDIELSPDDPSAVAQMDACIREHSIAAEKKTTDAWGSAVFSNLPLGLYYLKQTNYAEGYAPCKPFVVSVPDQSNGRYIYEIEANPKTEPAKFTDITVKKVWDVDETAQIADYVEVELLRDGLPVETAVLNETNNWEVTYSDMPESDSYSVVELNIPEGFTAIYTSKGYEFTVTNKISPGVGGDEPGEPGEPGEPDGSGEFDDEPQLGEETEDPTLAQTGQLVWPVPVLAMTGLCLITVGTIVLRKTGDHNA